MWIRFQCEKNLWENFEGSQVDKLDQAYKNVVLILLLIHKEV